MYVLLHRESEAFLEVQPPAAAPNEPEYDRLRSSSDAKDSWYSYGMYFRLNCVCAWIHKLIIENDVPKILGTPMPEEGP